MGGLRPNYEQKNKEHEQCEYFQNCSAISFRYLVEAIHALAGLRSIGQAGLDVVFNAGEGVGLLGNQRRHL